MYYLNLNSYMLRIHVTHFLIEKIIYYIKILRLNTQYSGCIDPNIQKDIENLYIYIYGIHDEKKLHYFEKYFRHLCLCQLYVYIE